MTNQNQTNVNIEAARNALTRRLDNERHIFHEMWRLENVEKITGQAYFVKGLEAASLIFNTIKRVPETDKSERDLVEIGIRRMMEQLGTTHISIALAKGDLVEIAFCGDLGIEEEVDGDTRNMRVGCIHLCRNALGSS